MTSKPELLTILKELLAAFPGYPVSEDLVDFYLKELEDMPFEVLQVAALDHGSRNKWFPKPCELRRAAVDIRLDSRHFPSAYDEWSEVYEARNDYRRYIKPKFANPITRKVIAALGWRNLGKDGSEAADRARFIEAYNEYRQRQIDEAMTLPQVKELTARLAGRSVSDEPPEMGSSGEEEQGE